MSMWIHKLHHNMENPVQNNIRGWSAKKVKQIKENKQKEKKTILKVLEKISMLESLG